MNYQFKTGYKNIKKTILLALSFGLLCLTLSLIFLPVTLLTSELLGTMTFVISLIILGRTIIVRHEVRKGNLVIVEFLFRPRHKIVYGPDKVHKIEYMEIDWGRYGRYTKGVIVFNEKIPNKPLRLKDILTNELTWFWMK